MINLQIKSILKNKINLLYIILFIIVFIIINLAINLPEIIYKYYDSKIPEEYKELARTLYIADGNIELTNEDMEDLKKIEHIQDVKIKTLCMQDYELELTNIVVDDWKNCSKIQNILDKQGILTGREYEDDWIKGYEKINIFMNLVVYMSIIIGTFTILISYINILKNEKENHKLLYILGYSKSKIRYIVCTQILAITIIGFFIGIIIFDIIFQYVIPNILNIELEQDMYKSIIINILVTIIPLFIATGKSTSHIKDFKM